jgi:hypothetical protein
MEKRVKYGGILLLFLIVGLLLYGYFFHISHTQSPLSFKTAIHVNAGDLIRLSNRNESLFDRQYLYKVLSVRGVVQKIKKNRDGITVLLEGPPSLPQAVSCSLDTLYNSRQPDLRPGDSCTILGNCAGSLKDVILLQCIVKK